MMGPEDFELGDVVTDVFIAPREKRGIVLSVRFSMDEATEINRMSEFEKQTMTEFAREAILKSAYATHYRVEELSGDLLHAQ